MFVGGEAVDLAKVLDTVNIISKTEQLALSGPKVSSRWQCGLDKVEQATIGEGAGDVIELSDRVAKATKPEDLLRSNSMRERVNKKDKGGPLK